jgi:hypothetical protein
MPSVQELEAAIRACAAERQALHERGAASDELERNRLEIVRMQWQLSRAWIERHLSESRAAA